MFKLLHRRESATPHAEQQALQRLMFTRIDAAYDRAMWLGDDNPAPEHRGVLAAHTRALMLLDAADSLGAYVVLCRGRRGKHPPYPCGKFLQWGRASGHMGWLYGRVFA